MPHLHPPLTRLSHASHTPLTRLLHVPYTPLTRLLHASYTPLTAMAGHEEQVPHVPDLTTDFTTADFTGITAVAGHEERVSHVPQGSRAPPQVFFLQKKTCTHTQHTLSSHTKLKQSVLQLTKRARLPQAHRARCPHKKLAEAG